jgi:hypothetical protein
MQQYKNLHTLMKPAFTMVASDFMHPLPKLPLENKHMLRLLKVLPAALALVLLGLFAMSCGSGNSAQVRVVNAISDGPAFDIEVNTVKSFTDIAFQGVQPAPPAYTGVTSGSDTIAVVDTGTTTQVFSNSANLNGGTQYTMLLSGYLNGTGLTAPAANVITDNNTAPATGNVEFRVINGSTTANDVDVYIIPPDTGIGGLTPQISGLLLGQASSYVSLNYSANGYAIIVTPSGNQTPYVNQVYTPPTNAIRTIVLTDVTGGGFPSEFPIVLNDLN